MRSNRSVHARALAASLCVAAAGGVTWWRASRGPETAPIERRVGEGSGAPAMAGASDTTVTITPDGRAVVYTGERVDQTGTAHDTLLLHQLDTNAVRTLLSAAPGAEARSPFISDDGAWVGFIDRGRLMKVPVAGGPAEEICACGASAAGGALWLRDGRIIYHAGSRLRVLETRGRRRDLTRLDGAAGERDHLGPAVLADQETVLYTVVNRDATAAVRAVNLRTGKQKVLVPGGMFARDAGNGHVVYLDTTSTLRVADLDAESLRLSGDAPIAGRKVLANSRGGASFAVSKTGTLVYAPSVDTAPTGLMLAWVARDGRQHASGLPPGAYALARISPAGDTVAIEVRADTFNIWTWDLATNALTPRTTGERNTFPVWMPDGRSLLMLTTQEQRSRVQRLWLDGTGRVTPVAAPALTGIFAVAPDGQLGVFRSERPGAHLRAMPTDGGAVVRLTQGPGRELAADLSPDGRWMVYEASPRAGTIAASTAEVFVQPFPAGMPARQQISVGGGSRPLWSRDGREIIYIDRKNHLMRVEVTGGEHPAFGAPTPVFTDPAVTADWYFGLGRRSFDLTPDGSRFLVVTSSTASIARRPSSLVVASGWLRHAHRPWTRLLSVARRRLAGGG